MNINIILDCQLGAALNHAVNSLSDNGEVVVVDYGDFLEMQKIAAHAIESWLGWFHVRLQSTAFLRACGAPVEHGPGRYYLRARITRADWEQAALAPSQSSG